MRPHPPAPAQSQDDFRMSVQKWTLFDFVLIGTALTDWIAGMVWGGRCGLLGRPRLTPRDPQTRWLDLGRHRNAHSWWVWIVSKTRKVFGAKRSMLTVPGPPYLQCEIGCWRCFMSPGENSTLPSPWNESKNTGRLAHETVTAIHLRKPTAHEEIQWTHCVYLGTASISRGGRSNQAG
jgi:hypothetical protein